MFPRKNPESSRFNLGKKTQAADVQQWMNRSTALALCLMLNSTFADESVLPARADFHLFLLAGQSNMAGRGVVTPEDQKPLPGILMLSQEGKWVPAIDPMHFDKPKKIGVGLGRTFAVELSKKLPGVTIGLIPCAVGGSPIDTWQPGVIHEETGAHPWDDMMKRMQLALPAGTLKGILWHQGESDAEPGLSETYEAKLHDLIGRFRKTFESPDLPFLAGQMGRFEGAPWTEDRERVNRAHIALPDRVPGTAFISAKGLHHLGDRLHFDAESYRELGRRYAEAWWKLVP